MRKNCSCGHDESSHSTDGCTFAQCTCELFVSKVNKVTEKIASEISARQSLLANRIDPKKIIEMNSNKQENKLSNIKEKLDTSKFETKSENWDKIEKIKDEINDLQNDEYILESRKQEKILNLLGELLVLEPKDGKVWQIRGWILKAREDKSGAKLCFEPALLYDRENISILDDLMIISMNLDLYDDALSYAKKILEIDPENTQALNSKAWIIMSKEGEENLKRASEIFEKI